MLLFWMNIIVIPTKNIQEQCAGPGGVPKFFKQRAHLLKVPDELKKLMPKLKDMYKGYKNDNE